MWKTLSFEECVVKVKTPYKLPKSKYKEKGIFPVISQETDFISGYHDDDKNTFKVDKPVIVFGDHTRVLKYIDFDFVSGADGVKIIKPINEIDTKFLYYMLHILIPNTTGYARHYKLLKELNISFPPLAEQERIVAKLDAAFAEIDEAIESTSKSIKNSLSLRVSALAVVTEHNGSDKTTKTLGELFKLSSGKFLPKKEMNTDGSIKVIGGNGVVGSHDEANLSGTNVVIGRVGAKCGNVHFFDEDIWLTDNAMYAHSFSFVLDEEFLAQALASLNLGAYARQAAQPVISFSSIKDVPLTFPLSLSEQREIVSKYNKIKVLTDLLIETRSRQMIELNYLKSAILEQELQSSEAA